jgi:hypothetical protein
MPNGATNSHPSNIGCVVYAEPRHRFQARIGIAMMPGFTAAYVAAMPCSTPQPNSIQVADGRVSGNRIIPKASYRALTPVTA